ncbi:protein kinase [Nocardioides sp. cx-173]|uniref:protein kinase domain-containing protein n=1 Tax=Nocardioides sp. cx-173 TaxID=2898796 RepID=UPI001E35FBAE|nr:protein kinase [Nocardioides sp. cx-173]MCD4525020.1 protein kinase [Nocardioides sp. cx-173]UGB40272.1 protein kinase [Nocardioides sp. cx-173]
MSTDRVIAGRYELGEVIGFGATAEVHRGRDTRSGRAVAIKMLRKDLARDPLFRSRLRREAMTVAGLSHPAIVAVYDTGHEEVDDGSAGTVRVPFIVMEYVAGRSLRDLLRMRPLTRDEAIHYQVGILAALDVSHRAGVVHRDIKPANVMITPEDAVKLVDFGISSAQGPAATLTQAQVFLGTPSYLSPEQARGQTADARSDLYSAGCVLHELLTGRPPFVGDDPVAVAYQHVHEEPAQVPTGLPALDAVLAKALAKRREDRFQDARSFREALLCAMRDTAPLGLASAASASRSRALTRC